jgi:tetrahydromethanopterin S-methyltransferase subunit F
MQNLPKIDIDQYVMSIDYRIQVLQVTGQHHACLMSDLFAGGLA